MELGNYKSTHDLITRHNFSIQKKYGQNFLIDERVLDKIINASELTEDDYVIEIGPGIGTMTQRIAKRAKRVSAIEIDRELIPILNETLNGYDNVEIINDDVLKVDLRALIDKNAGGRAAKIVANLPYYITTPIIMSLLEEKLPIDTITVMVQKEVALRMMVGPGTKDYGALSLAVKFYSKPYIVANVPVNCFIPRPRVDSAVIRLTVYDKPPVEVRDEKLMFKLIRASFNQRRKTLVNGIINYPELDYTREQLITALNIIGKPENVRGETFDLNTFAALTDALCDM